MDLYSEMEACLVNGKSLSAEAEPLLSNMSINRLRLLLYRTRSRDKVWNMPEHLFREFKEHLFRLGYDPRNAEVRLSEFMCRRLSNLPTVPSTATVLHHSRLQFAKLIANLSRPVQQKLLHVWRVQLCHNLTKHALLGRGAVTYVVNGADPVAGQLYPLDQVQSCHMTWHKDSQANYVSTLLAINDMRLDNYQVQTQPGRLVDMSFVPLTLDEGLSSFYAAALDMHAVAEMSIAQGRGVRKQAPLPTMWACFSSGEQLLDHIARTTVTPALHNFLCQRLNQFIHLCQDEVVTQLTPVHARYRPVYEGADQALLKIFVTSPHQLRQTNNAEEAVWMLCDLVDEKSQASHTDFLINTLLMSAACIADDGELIFPLEFLAPVDGVELPAVKVEFPTLTFFGRDAYGSPYPGGPMRYYTDNKLAAVHVVGA